MLAGLAWALPARSQPGVAPSILDYASRALARLIEVTRERVIADGVRPMPAMIHRALLGYFPDALMRKVRYVTGQTEAISLPNLAFTYGDTAAMTLGDVIVFRDERRAQSDVKLWAHELTHVMQYQRLGIEGFADRYVQNSSELEREAYGNADRFLEWRKHPAR
jgi:Domain of unknown function (DUF4157)